jgi:broad specificity phosphatase PhoE
MKVYLIRHAPTLDAKEQISQRHITSILKDSETIQKIEKVKQKIKDVEQRYSSPMVRAVETSNLIFGPDNYQVIDYIYEYKTPKEIIGKSRDVAINYWEQKHKKDKMDIHWKPEGGESFFEIYERVKRFYEFLLSEKKSKKYSEIAVIGHGTFFRYLLLQIYGISAIENPQLIFDVLRRLNWENLQIIDCEV